MSSILAAAGTAPSSSDITTTGSFAITAVPEQTHNKPVRKYRKRIGFLLV
jgi:hypothetical protein